MRKIFQQTEFWIAVIGVAIWVCIWQFRLRFPFDDAYISFRYAEHLASGNGLVWNIGGPHTEGFTNFLFVVILAITKFITSDLLVSAQMIGVTATIMTGIVLYRTVLRLRDRSSGILAVSLFWAVPLTWVNALSGMETSLFVMLCSLAIYYTVQERFITAFCSVFFAFLTRPEAALLAVIIVSCVMIYSSERRQAFLAFRYAFVLPAIVYMVWKYFYFGGILPNAFFIKVVGEAHRTFPGLQYVRLFIASSIALILLSIFVRGWKSVGLLAAGAWAVCLTAFFIFVLPIEGLYDRFLWPVFTVLCMTGAIGARDLAVRLKGTSFRWIAGMAFAGNMIVVLITPRAKQAFAAHEDIWDANMDHIVSELKMLPHFDSLKLAYGDAGYVVYKSGINHIDLFGLNDTRVAHAWSNISRGEVVLAEHPDIMLLPIKIKDDSTASFIEDAYGRAREGNFENCATIEAFPYTLMVLVNRDSPFYLDCRDAIRWRVSERTGYLRAAPEMYLF